MSDTPSPQDSLAEEFISLGKNLFGALQAAWESQERKQVQDEMVNGLNELGKTIQHEAQTFSESPTGQQFKADMEQLGERFRSGEAQEKMRTELLSILRTANTELSKVVDQWSGKSST